MLTDDEIIAKLRDLKSQTAGSNRMDFGGCCLVNLDDGSGSIAIRNCPNVGTCLTCGTIFQGAGQPLHGPCTGDRIYDWTTLRRVK